jgi:hypothetical protein
VGYTSKEATSEHTVVMSVRVTLITGNCVSCFLAAMLPLSLIFLACCALVHAGSANKGENCSQSDSRLQTGTFQFFSDCNSVTYCAPNNTCLLKQCRKDDFPFGYATGAHLPDKCDPGQFCPDEGDACLPVQTVGSKCQLNRDGAPCPTCLLLSLTLPR